MTIRKTNVPTRNELVRLMEDRKNDPPRLQSHLVPPWALDSEDAAMRAIRMRERRIRFLTLRLDKATRQMEQDFDHSM